MVGLATQPNFNYTSKTNLFNFSEDLANKSNLSANDPSSIILFGNNNNLSKPATTTSSNTSSEQPGADKIKADEAKGFKPKDIFEVDKIFIKMLKAAIGPAMTYLISECAFTKCDKDGNKVLTSDEYSDLTTNFDMNASDNKDDNLQGNKFLKNILELLTKTGDSAIAKVPGVSEVKEAFVNTLKMMIGVDKNNNGKIEKSEFSTFLEEKSTEPIPEDIKNAVFSTLSTSQQTGQSALDLGSFTKFAFESKLAWYPTKKINTERVKSDFSEQPKDKDINKKEAPMVV